MIGQTELSFDAPPPFSSPERRIDTTLDTLRHLYEGFSEPERAELGSKPWWSDICMVSQLRAMERGEEEALGRPSPGLADIYDQIVSPGEHAGEALLRVLRTMIERTSTLPLNQ